MVAYVSYKVGFRKWLIASLKDGTDGSQRVVQGRVFMMVSASRKVGVSKERKNGGMGEEEKKME